MRVSSESKVKREPEGNYAETALDPEAIEDVRVRRGVRIQSKHKHTDATGERECRRLNW